MQIQTLDDKDALTFCTRDEGHFLTGKQLG